jgi:thioredoxin reductase (NADPH)
VQFLCRAHELHPTAKRVLFITYGDAAGGMAGLQAMALGQLDHYLNAPWGPPELQLYPTLSEALSQWAKATSSLGSGPELVCILGPRWSPRSHELRDLLARNSISHGLSTQSRSTSAASRWRACPHRHKIGFPHRDLPA